MKSNEGAAEGKPARWQQTTHFLCSDIRFVSGLFLIIIMKEAWFQSDNLIHEAVHFFFSPAPAFQFQFQSVPD